MTAAFVVLLAGLALTIAEGFVLPVTLNLVEHVCYAASAVLLCAWCWRTLTGERRP